MLSLPLIAPPPPDPSPYLSTTWRPRADSPPPANGNQHPHSQRQQRQQREDEKKAQARSPLAQLNADEAAIAQRKAAIRNFGAYWIRPPGIAKTLQAQTEEEAERAEQEELARQERGMMDLQAQQQLEETRRQAAETAVEADASGEEHDLDDDIPEAEEADQSNLDTSGAGEVSFNEDSVVEGSSMLERQNAENEIEMEVAELTGAAQDEEDLGMEQDLDNSVPEAGSYQHTDTEVEDSTSESELQDSFVQQPSTQRSTGRSRQAALNTAGPSLAAIQAPPSEMRASRLQDRLRAYDDLPRSPGSLNLSSSLLESSFVSSSPVMTRAGQSSRGRGASRRRGRLS